MWADKICLLFQTLIKLYVVMQLSPIIKDLVGFIMQVIECKC